MRRLLVIVTAAALLWGLVGGTMSKADAQYICSPMSGVLIGPGGTPVAGATVRREWIYNSKSESDSVTTDAAGRFGFDAVNAPRRGWLSGLSTPVVVQRYYASTGGEETEILYINSRSLEPLHETDGKPFAVTCDLSQSPGNGALGWGVCALN
ncbi:DUF6795 domain-containing protein [Tateyamaria sp. SN6-1]|uniref:DUF6795 domain-containing protein n=1 Tax=Tateyamaria sp. SN6-1 TaxID=3092148 RepID=UPI0039F54D5F